MKYKAVIFDLDGTLLDTLEDLADSMNVVLQRWACPTHDLDQYKVFVGDGIHNLARRVLPDAGTNKDIVERCVEQMRLEYGRRWDKKSKPYEGIAEMLDALIVSGIKLAVLSNKPHDFTKICVEKLLAKWQFDVVMGISETVPAKPDTAGALQVVEALGVTPGEVLYLGDTDTDMQTAVAAGFFPVGAVWGFRTAEELTANGAKALAQKPADVIELLS